MKQDLNMKRPASPSVLRVQSEDDRGLHNPKRVCGANVGEPHTSNLPNNSETVPTILDVLNPDCWRLVLDQLSINDVVRSERVSRGWRQMVQQYLAGVRNYWIMDLGPQHYTFKIYKTTPGFESSRIIVVPRRNTEMFRSVVEKMGPYIVTLTCRYVNTEMLAAIAANCPNLEDLKIRLVRQQGSEREHIGLVANCTKLRRMTFNLTDDDETLLNEIVTSQILEELTICGASAVGFSGRFLNHMSAYNLRTLGFIFCKSLVLENVVSAANHMTGLSRLVLCRNPLGTLRNVHLLLKELPTLEHLSLNFYNERSSEVVAAIGGLRRLKELNLWGGQGVTDDWLKVFHDCLDLRVLNVGRTKVTSRGLAEFCRSQSLVELVAVSLKVSEEEMVACVRSCPGLRHLDVWHCEGLTQGFPARVAWPRECPLRLRMGKEEEFMDNYKEVTTNEVQYEGLNLVRSPIDYYARIKPI